MLSVVGMDERPSAAAKSEDVRVVMCQFKTDHSTYTRARDNCYCSLPLTLKLLSMVFLLSCKSVLT